MANIMDMLSKALADTKPSTHPRADDLLDAAGLLLEALQDVTEGLERVDAGDFVAIEGLFARLPWFQSLISHVEHIKADLGGEGYCRLSADTGEGIPYFTDDDYDEDDAPDF